MAPMRSTQTSWSRLLFFCLLCITVAMQMLGTTTSLWTLQFASDPVSASISEGFSLTPAQLSLIPRGSTTWLVDPPAANQPILHDEVLLRPPSSVPKAHAA